MKTLIGLSIFTALMLWYALWGREWLKTRSWAEGFFAWIEPIEITLFKKSETILFARSLQSLGAILTFLTWIGSIDLTPLLPLFPEEHQKLFQGFFSCLPLILNGLGAVVEWLRNRTTKPLELVEIPDKVVAENPVVADAIAKADEGKAIAVAEIKVAAAVEHTKEN